MKILVQGRKVTAGHRISPVRLKASCSALRARRTAASADQ